MRRSISMVALLLASVSTILGSGWLFVAFYTSTLAGPAAILSWVIGGLMIAVVAFVFAELSAMLPITGSSTRIPQYTHGTLVSFVFSWMIWLAYAALTPTEVQAVIQYLNFFYPNLTYVNGGLTKNGYIVATFLMVAISAINTFSLRWLMHSNTLLTIMKILIPTCIATIILMFYFHPSYTLHPNDTGFMPFGTHGVLAAIATGGIVFAFNGFKQACEMAGEAKKPSIALPIAIIGSVIICLLIYLLLQFAFISSMTASNLSQGWSHLQLNASNSPLASILYQDHLGWLIPLLYAGAIICPLAAGLMYMSSSSRSLYGKSKNEYLPFIFQRLNNYGNPAFAILVNFIIGMCMFAPLPGWDKMISFLTSLMAITYAIAPICLLALRRQLPDQHRPFKLPYSTVWGILAFYICTLLSYWSGWEVVSKLGISILVGLIILFVYYLTTERGRKLQLHWQSSIWIWPYFIGLSLISYLGNFGKGLGIIPFGWDFLIIALFCIIIAKLSQHFTLPAKVMQEYINQLNLNHDSNYDAV